MEGTGLGHVEHTASNGILDLERLKQQKAEFTGKLAQWMDKKAPWRALENPESRIQTSGPKKAATMVNENSGPF